MRSIKAKLFLQYTLPKKALTVFAGLLANVRWPWFKNYLIRDFIKKYDVDMQEAVHELPEAYQSFNDFFTRHLKPGLRPIANADVISPVDGAVSEFGPIEEGQLLQAKGKFYSVEEFLTEGCEPHIFEQGSFITLYLSPKDYHRVHMPLAGMLTHMTHVPGQLFSVQPATTARISKLFARNERLVLRFETEFGPVAAVFVGATVVGAIGTCWQGDLPRPKVITSYDEEVANWAVEKKTLSKADELGYFKLGSTVVLLFAKKVNWTPALRAGMSIRLGEALGDMLLNNVKEKQG